jgi:transmembrane sensor
LSRKPNVEFNINTEIENIMQIKELIEKFYLGSLTDDEMVLLLNYLKEKEPQHEILSYYQGVWDKSSEVDIDIDSKGIYDKVIGAVVISPVEMETEAESPDTIDFKSYIRTFMRYAAVFVVAFGLFWLTQSIFIKKTSTSPMAMKKQVTRIEVPFGSKSRVVLPDGSVVNLNSGSSLTYSISNFDSVNRSVFLIGEGFFNVTKNAERPFYVNTHGMKLKVLGTTFNVKAYPDDNTEEATLVTGKIEIFASTDKIESGKPIVLKPNQMAIFDKSKNNLHSSSKTDLANTEIVPAKLRAVSSQPALKINQTISWKEDMLTFDNENFIDLIKKIERWYDVKIVVNDPGLLSARFTGRFDKETIEQVLNALVTIAPFNYSIKQNLITISKK